MSFLKIFGKLYENFVFFLSPSRLIFNLSNVKTMENQHMALEKRILPTPSIATHFADTQTNIRPSIRYNYTSVKLNITMLA